MPQVEEASGRRDRPPNVIEGPMALRRRANLSDAESTGGKADGEWERHAGESRYISLLSSHWLLAGNEGALSFCSKKAAQQASSLWAESFRTEFACLFPCRSWNADGNQCLPVFSP